MHLVAERQRGRLVPRRERRICREGGGEDERQGAIRLRARDEGRRDADNEREDEKDTDVLAVEPSEGEREDDQKEQAPRDRVEREEAARPLRTEPGRDRER